MHYRFETRHDFRVNIRVRDEALLENGWKRQETVHEPRYIPSRLPEDRKSVV